MPRPAPTPLDATQTQNATLPGQFNITDMSSLLPSFQTFLQMQSMLQGRRMAMGGMLPTQKKEIVDVEDDSDTVMFEDEEEDEEDIPAVAGETTKARAGRLRQFRRGQVKRARELSQKRVQEGLKPYEIRIDEVGRARGSPSGLWTNMVRGYAKRLDPSITNLKAQPHGQMKAIKEAVGEQFEYKGFVNLINKLITKHLGDFMKNMRYCLLKAISAAQEVGEVLVQPLDVEDEHWEKLLNLSSQPQRQKTSSQMARVRRNQVNPHHVGRGGEVGATEALVGNSFMNV